MKSIGADSAESVCGLSGATEVEGLGLAARPKGLGLVAVGLFGLFWLFGLFGLLGLIGTIGRPEEVSVLRTPPRAAWNSSIASVSASCGVAGPEEAASSRFEPSCEADDASRGACWRGKRRPGVPRTPMRSPTTAAMERVPFCFRFRRTAPKMQSRTKSSAPTPTDTPIKLSDSRGAADTAAELSARPAADGRPGGVGDGEGGGGNAGGGNAGGGGEGEGGGRSAGGGGEGAATS